MLLRVPMDAVTLGFHRETGKGAVVFSPKLSEKAVMPLSFNSSSCIHGKLLTYNCGSTCSMLLQRVITHH